MSERAILVFVLFAGALAYLWHRGITLARSTRLAREEIVRREDARQRMKAWLSYELAGVRHIDTYRTAYAREALLNHIVLGTLLIDDVKQETVIDAMTAARENVNARHGWDAEDDWSEHVEEQEHGRMSALIDEYLREVDELLSGAATALVAAPPSDSA